MASLLLIEDNDVHRELLEVLLSGEFTVTGARNADDGLRLLNKQQIDCLITDYELGSGKNGLDLAAEASRRAIPSVLITGVFEQTRIHSLAMEAQVSAVLMKPFGFDKLRSAINAAISNTHRRA